MIFSIIYQSINCNFMVKKPLKVGFDLDGVILYNPARLARPLISLFKRLVLHRKKVSFYLPKTGIEKTLWRLFHKSSIFVAPGFDEIKKMAKKDEIEAYIITARYDFLKDDFESWLDKIQAKKYFKGCYYNKNNEQPNIFKERLIRQLKLDVFIEDNWDIVKYLNSKISSKGRSTFGRKNHNLKVFWIYNIMDKGLEYPYKFPSLNKALIELI